MRVFWMSWYMPPVPEENTEVPEGWPEGTRGWVSGENEDDELIFCARVEAEDEEHAEQRVLSWYGDFSRHIRWRFVDEKNPDWWPPSDRFPRKEPSR